MNKSLLSRRQFSAACAAFGLSFPGFSQVAAQGASNAAAMAKPASRTVKLPNGNTVSALGQGGWHLGQGRHPPLVEEEALRTGITLGMSLIDTSGNYGDGRSEDFIGRVIARERDRVFLVSKGEGDQVSGNGIARACAASLARLGAEYLDLYLLHWPCPSAQFPGVVAAFEQLRSASKIRAWGGLQFQRAPDGGSVRCARGASLRHQSGALQSQQPSH